MTRALMPDESEALANAELLLKFAAENAKDLPKTVVSSICAALDAQQTNKWDEKIAEDFWLAFHSICTLVKPVTSETLSTSLRTIPPPWWKFWARSAKRYSLASRSARRYLLLPFSLLSLLIILSFLLSTVGSLSKETDALIESGDKLTDQMVSEIDQLEPAIDAKKLSDVQGKDQEKIAHLQELLGQQDYLLLQTSQKTDLTWRLLTCNIKKRVSRVPSRPDLAPAKDIADFREAVRLYRKERADFVSDQLEASVVMKLYSSIIALL